MGKCRYCGQEAGLLKAQHPECATRRDAGRAQMFQTVLDAALGRTPGLDVAVRLEEIAQQSFMSSHECSEALVQGWQQAVESALDDGLLSHEEETSLAGFAQEHRLSQETLDTSGAYTRMVQSAVLRDVLDGVLPKRMSVEGNLPFNLLKNETLIWVFPSTRYYQMQTRTEYVGGSQGVSLRVAKGVYYRASAFRGHPVQRTQAVDLGLGILGVTDKQLYFAGPGKSFRVKYDKIVSFEPYSDGIGFQRDTQSAKPEALVTGDGWFTYNLISNVARGMLE